MPHQLVYLLPTDAAPTAESAVASAGIPEALRQVLLGLGRARRTDLEGMVYTYCLTEAAEHVWHVMSCFSPAATGGCVVHHLAFSADEASVLKHEESRPTPAGIMAGLVKDHFWCTGALPPADTELRAPQLNEDSLPDPTRQTVWQALTGHKHYAARPNKSPYDTRCTLLLPAGGSTKQVLRLLHESDWLTENCGWGVSFCAGADAEDARSPLRRLACGMQGEAARAAKQAGCPLLAVQREERAITPTQAFSMPYAYAEEPDTARFAGAHRRHCHTGKFALCVALPLLLLGGTALFVRQSSAPAGGETPTFTPLPATEEDAETDDEDGTTAPRQGSTAGSGGTAADDAAPEPSDTPIADEDSDEATDAPPISGDAPPATIGKPKLLQVGEKLPEALQAVLRQANTAPLRLPYGELLVAGMNGSAAQQCTLSQETPLLLERVADVRGQWRFSAGGEGGISFTLTVQQEHLVALESAGNPVAVRVSLPKGQSLLIPYILTSLPQAGDARKPVLKELPKAADFLPALGAEQLVIKQAGAAMPFGVLALKKKLPELPPAVRSCKLSFQCPLPQLGMPVQPCPPKRKLPKGYRYTWQAAPAKAGRFGGELLIERGMDDELYKAFDMAANSYCCGDAGKGDPFYSLATLYGITLAADRARGGNRQDLRAAEAAYARLFTDKHFNAILQQVLVHEPALTMDTALANDRTPEGKRRREMVQAGLRSADNCARIRQRVAEVLTNTLHAAYTRKAASYPPLPPVAPEFRELNRTAEGALQWKFNLIPAAETP